MTNKMLFTGKLFDINAALSTLKYTSRKDWNSVDGRNKDNVTLIVRDRGSSSTTRRDSYGDSTSKSLMDVHILYIYVRSINDAPIILVPGGTQVVDEDVPIRISGVSIDDVDLSHEDNVEMTISCSFGRLRITAFEERDYDEGTNMENPNLFAPGDDLKGVSFTTGSGYGSGKTMGVSGNYDDSRDSPTKLTSDNTWGDTKFVVIGSIKRMNQMLKHLKYKSKLNYNGVDQITVTINDLGGDFGEEPMSTTKYIDLSVTAVNDAPVITVPLAFDGTKMQRIKEDGLIRITGTRYHNRPIVAVPELYTSGYELFRSEGVVPDADWPNWRHRKAAEIYPGRAPSSPGFFENYNGAMYFSADDGVHGRELWRTSHALLEQTQATTELVKDIFPGGRGSDPQWLITMGGTLFFVSDGVDTTWMEITDACSGFRKSSLSIQTDSKGTTTSTIDIGGYSNMDRTKNDGGDFVQEVYYAVSASNIWDPNYVYDCPAGYHWASTDEALQWVVSSSSSAQPNNPIHTEQKNMKTSYYDQCGWDGYIHKGKKRVKFRFSDSHRTGGYKSAGTREDGDIVVGDFVKEEFAGTICVKEKGDDTGLVDSDRCRREINDPTRALPRIDTSPCYIRAGRELWRTDGSQNGTYRAVDIRHGVESSSPSYLIKHELSNTLFFSANAEPYGRELYRFTPNDVGSSRHGVENLSPRNGSIQLDLIEDIRVGSQGSNPRYLTLLDATATDPSIYFNANDGVRGEELWFSDGKKLTSGDGSGSGTHIVKDIYAGSGSSNPEWIVMLDPLGGTRTPTPGDVTTCIFTAEDGILGRELWKSDGTSGGTSMILDINPGADSSNPSHLTFFDMHIYFSADNGEHGYELWRTDGTTPGTVMIHDLCKGNCNGSPGFFSGSFIAPLLVPQPERLFFTANPSVEGREMWVVKPGAGGSSSLPVVERAFQDTTTDIDIDEERHMKDYPVRLADYRGSIYWSGNEGEDPDTKRPRGGTYVGPGRNGTWSALVINDVDMTSEQKMKIKLFSAKGKLSLARTDGLTFATGSGTNDMEMAFEGLLNDVNLAFEWLTYDTLLNENGADAITIVVNDTGQTGEHGNAQVATNTIDIWIDEENDAPTVGGPSTAQATRNMDNMLPVITVDDIDIGDSPLEITLRVRYGRLTLNSLRSLSFGGSRGHGTGVMDRQMVFYGNLRAVNDALRGMQYICRSVTDSCLSGKDSVTVQVRDLDQGGDNDLTTKFRMEIAIREPTVDEVQGYAGNMGTTGPAV
jgi:ELWxxDGT repeat protein